MSKYEDTKSVKCSFCGKAQENVRRIIAGAGVYICDECIGLCANLIDDDEEMDNVVETGMQNTELTPKEMKEKLDAVFSHMERNSSLTSLELVCMSHKYGIIRDCCVYIRMNE